MARVKFPESRGRGRSTSGGTLRAGRRRWNARWEGVRGGGCSEKRSADRENVARGGRCQVLRLAMTDAKQAMTRAP